MYARIYHIYFPSPITPFYKAVCPSVGENVYSLADDPQEALVALYTLLEEHVYKGKKESIPDSPS